ncbi:ABC transporter permease [Maledivibacter halophilus]|uniref:Osmoprotectant transport system permease protein n=1 Tax=Maledivibacter halophilus TaxID=36842 RepID=A0A1T5J6V6_9FIRM|nr:ABC transporter permease [Maledivibacter halophilus]SKC46963.1 osmoprotectant transport system permease protein [Maledivibacter halophilus]
MNNSFQAFTETIVNRWPRILDSLGQHMNLTLISLGLAIIIAVPLGIFLTRHRKLADVIIGIAAVFQTIPSLALLGFMIPVLGIGFTPAVVALTVYGLLPILRNTYTGIVGVDQGAIEAGKGMGMTTFQILFMVEIPLSLSIIMAGVRTATVMIIGVATLASLVGAGGLGDLIFRGISSVNANLILAGAIPAAVLAILFDNLLKFFEFKLTPRGMR